MEDKKSRITDATSAIRCINAGAYLRGALKQDMAEFAAGGQLKSGYDNLDAITSLYPGLYVLGAISSLGKTTFAHQMADQMAAAGQPVLFFSLEQDTLDLVSKSLSRIMARTNSLHAMTSLQIRKHGGDPRVDAAAAQYNEYADNVTIATCNFRATIDDIERCVHAYIRQRGKKPVVIVDYLQVIQPSIGTMSTRDAVDQTVRRLKQLQTDNKLVLIVISSLNRANYDTLVGFASFKESGGIEYTADVVWGLQLTVLHDTIFDQPNRINEKREAVCKAKAEVPRKVELTCLKNRFGVASYTCQFRYYPAWDTFVPYIDAAGQAAINAAAEQDPDGFTKIPDGFDAVPFN